MCLPRCRFFSSCYMHLPCPTNIARERELARRSEKPLTYQDLLAVKPGMSYPQVLAILGKPPEEFHWTESRQVEGASNVDVLHENFHYSDGQNDLFVGLADGKVDSLDLREGYAQGRIR